MDEEQNVKIGDFGLATSIVPYGKSTGDTPEDNVVGTTTYSSPEGGRGDKSDIYSLGIIFFEVLRSTPFLMSRWSIGLRLKWKDLLRYATCVIRSLSHKTLMYMNTNTSIL